MGRVTGQRRRRGALLECQICPGHQGNTLWGWTAIAAVKQSGEGRLNAQGQVRDFMMGEGGTQDPVLPAPLWGAIAPVDRKAESGFRPVRQACQLQQGRAMRRLRPDNERFCPLKAFPVVEERRQPGAVIRVDVGEVESINVVNIQPPLP